MTKYIIVFMLCFASLNAKAHIVNSTKYVLFQYGEQQQWFLEVTLKTATLHKKIIKLHPALKNKSLHSVAFQERAMDYLIDNLKFQEAGKNYEFVQTNMHVGGQVTRVMIHFPYMPPDINRLSIEITCFIEQKEHTANELSIRKNNIDLVHTFSEVQTQASFDFNQFAFKPSKTTSSPQFASFRPMVLLSSIGVLIAILLFIIYFIFPKLINGKQPPSLPS